MEPLDEATIRRFLSEVGRRHARPGRLFLVGGSALVLLGSTRPTEDIDYLGSDVRKDALQRTIDQVGAELHIVVEAVPLSEFVPIPPDAADRHRFVGRFGLLEVFVFDPYSIALSKIDRGFNADIDDIVFLVRSRMLEMARLEAVVDQALASAREFDLSPGEAHAHLSAVRYRLMPDSLETSQ